MPDNKLKRINDLIDELEDEIDQPIWSDNQLKGLMDAQDVLGDVKESIVRTDIKYSKGRNTHVAVTEEGERPQ
jgi:hypothetical protein